MRMLAVLNQRANHANTGGLHQALKFIEGMFPAEVSVGIGDGNKNSSSTGRLKIVADRFGQGRGFRQREEPQHMTSVWRGEGNGKWGRPSEWQKLASPKDHNPPESISGESGLGTKQPRWQPPAVRRIGDLRRTEFATREQTTLTVRILRTTMP